MEPNFSSRFKYKISFQGKKSIFNNLVPIDKELKSTQIHEKISLGPKNPKATDFELHKQRLADINIDFLRLFPLIAQTGSTRTTPKSYSNYYRKANGHKRLSENIPNNEKKYLSVSPTLTLKKNPMSLISSVDFKDHLLTKFYSLDNKKYLKKVLKNNIYDTDGLYHNKY
jgi:hypothetical protein